jgi:predicted RNase H-like nuclease
VDACKSGWIAVILREDTGRVLYLREISELARAIPDAEVVAIDIPIGLPTINRRIADDLARDYVGERRNSVFYVPVREALEEECFDEANRRSRELTGHGISKQSHSLRRKILEVEEWLPSSPCDVREVHPEVSFRRMLGRPLTWSKKSWAGMRERLETLKGKNINLEMFADEAGDFAGVDDMLDAAAAVWSARRILHGDQESLPNPPEIDSLGKRIAIWY